MRCPDRIIVTAGALALAFALGGCESLSNFGVLEDLFSNKKPLPGERRAVFPEGVPGVAQGVPAELMPGNQPDQAQAALPEPTETGSTPAKPEAAPAARAKPKAQPQPKKEATRVRQPASQPSEPAWPAAQPAARPAPADQPWPAPPTRQQPAPAPWPEPQPGTLTR